MNEPQVFGTTSKMKRKNTKSDLSFRSASFLAVTPIPDDGTIAGQTFNDETSDTVRVKRKSHKGPSSKVISAVMLWVKNINKMRTIQMTKAFYRWKYFRPAQLLDESSSAPPEPLLNEQKSSFLQLFAENERLREQTLEIKRSSASYEKQLRVAAMKMVMVSVLRKKLMMKIRYYFDLWMNNARMINMVIASSEKAIELEVGLQQVESERDYVRKTQTENAKLRMILSLTIYFFKWKSKVALSILRDERAKYELQRHFIFNELRRMRQSIVEANVAEQGVLHEAKTRGSDALEQIIHLREKLQQMCMNSSGAKQRSRTNSGESDSYPGRKAGSVGGSSRRSSSRK